MSPINPGPYGAYCNHRWVRDDSTTAQCVNCGTYAPAEEVLR